MSFAETKMVVTEWVLVKEWEAGGDLYPSVTPSYISVGGEENLATKKDTFPDS